MTWDFINLGEIWSPILGQKVRRIMFVPILGREKSDVALTSVLCVSSFRQC